MSILKFNLHKQNYPDTLVSSSSGNKLSSLKYQAPIMLKMFYATTVPVCICKTTRTVRGSDYSPAIELSEQKGKLVTATGDTEKYFEKQAKSG